MRMPKGSNLLEHLALSPGSEDEDPPKHAARPARHSENLGIMKRRSSAPATDLAAVLGLPKVAEFPQFRDDTRADSPKPNFHANDDVASVVNATRKVLDGKYDNLSPVGLKNPRMSDPGIAFRRAAGSSTSAAKIDNSWVEMSVCQGTAELAAKVVTGLERGKQKQNAQDVYMVEKNFMGSSGTALLGIFDGHGPNGHHIARSTKVLTPQVLKERLEQAPLNVEQALVDTIMQVDGQVCRQSPNDAANSGTTAVVVYLHAKTLTTAWVGDSKCVLGREVKGALTAVELTHDHKPENKPERTRIESSGGRVDRYVLDDGTRVGPLRIFEAYEFRPGLNISRSIGDFKAKALGVVSMAETSQISLKPDDKYMVLATDGIWEFVTPQEAVDVCLHYNEPLGAMESIIEKAARRWKTEEGINRDDIGVVCVFFRWPKSPAVASTAGSRADGKLGSMGKGIVSK